MSRKARLHSPGSLAHIMAHSIEGRPLFVDKLDRQEFLFRFENLLKKTGYECHSWTLMDNHYHLVVRTNENPMSDLMRPLNGGYALWYNKKYKRRGYLFQDRFASVLCQDSDYAKELIRYVHLNPLRAKQVSTLEELEIWPWCGHGYLLGIESSLGKGFQERIKPLRRFGEDEESALKKYLEYINEGFDGMKSYEAGKLGPIESFEIDGSKKGWPAVIGDHDFVINAMKKHAIRSHRQHRPDKYEKVMEGIEKSVTEKYSIAKDDLITCRRRKINTIARQEFCKVAFDEELLPMSAIARFLQITIPAVAKLTSKKSAVKSTS
jgi:putative transposase